MTSDDDPDDADDACLGSNPPPLHSSQDSKITILQALKTPDTPQYSKTAGAAAGIYGEVAKTLSALPRVLGNKRPHCQDIAKMGGRQNSISTTCVLGNKRTLITVWAQLMKSHSRS